MATDIPVPEVGERVTEATLTGIAWGAAATGGGADLQPAKKQTVAQTARGRMRREFRVKDTVFLLQIQNINCNGLPWVNISAGQTQIG